MERVLDVPMTRLLGLEVIVQVGGRDRFIRVGVLECDIPLPSETTEGASKFQIIAITTESRIELDKRDVPTPNMSIGKLRPWVVEELLYQALGREHPTEEELSGLVSTKRKIRTLGPEPVEEKKPITGM